MFDIMPSLTPKQWHFLGCVSAEERSIGARLALHEAGIAVASESWYRIEDGLNRFSMRTEEKVTDRETELSNFAWQIQERVSLDLLCPYDEIVEAFLKTVEMAGQSILVDISSFPKRFFFPLVRLISKVDSLSDVVFLYSVPEKYGCLPISEEIEALDSLPLFAPDPNAGKPDVLLLCLGLQSLGVLELIEASGGVDVQLLVPFSSTTSVRSALLHFQKSVEANLATKQLKPIRFVSPLDVSSAYDEMLRAVGREKSAALAPFGPKPVSLAMALLGSTHGWPAYYSQPKVYNPDYSIGVASAEGNRATYAYLAKSNGHSFY